MAGLEAYDENTPAGGDNVNLGDNKIRELAQKTKTSIDSEHHLSGEHNIPRGTTGDKPAATKDGRFFILENVGVEAELQYSNGAAWTGLSKNQAVTDMQADITTLETDLATHQTDNPIDHPASSITYDKIAYGAIRRGHVNSVDGDPTGEFKKLLNGTEISTALGTTVFHTHEAPAGDPLGITFLPNVVPVASVTGGGDVGWTTKIFSLSDVPVNAKAVILQARGEINAEAIGNQCFIKIRKNSSSDDLFLIGNMNVISQLTVTGYMGQGIYPVAIVSGQANIDYKATAFSVYWGIELIGYVV